jgi:phospholipid transport system substrate-binding protein
MIMGFSINAASRRQLLQAGASLLGVVALGAAGHAEGDATGAAARVVERLVDRVLGLIGQEGDDQLAELMAAIEQETDLELLARLTLGRYWRQATAAQRETYVALFKSYLLRTFADRLKRYAGKDPAEARRRVEIIDAKAVNQRDVIVRSKVRPPTGMPLQVDWRLRQDGPQPVIIDLIVEGVSLLITQRGEFAAVLDRSGVDGLISDLRGRIGAENEGRSTINAGYRKGE